MKTTEPAWYCIRSHPKHEHIAAANLRHVPDLEVFNPQLRLLRCTPRGRVAGIEPLFPNYLFARFVLELTLEKVRFTPSVSKVLSFGDRVPSIPDDVIAELRSSLDQQEERVFTDAPLEGQEVEVVAGPLQGAHATVTRVLPAKERVQVLIEILGQSTITELNLQSLTFERYQAARFVLPNTNAPGASPALMLQPTGFSRARHE
jgi:transcriptional antiterminator RfaH